MLKSCVCGGKAIHIKLFDSKRYDCYFKCEKCGKETKVYRSKQSASKAWNERRFDYNAKAAVMCKGCKYSEEFDDVLICNNTKTPWYNDEFNIFMNETDFCSYGERRKV